MSSLTPMGSASELAEISAKRIGVGENQTTPTKIIGSPFFPIPRLYDDDNPPPFKPFKPIMPRNPKKSDTMRITPALLEASARLALVMLEPDPEFPQLQNSKLKRQQKKDTEMAEDNVRFRGPFLRPSDGEVIEPHVNNDLGRIDQAYWGEAAALRLPGRANLDGNEDHQISRHLMIPTKSTGGPAISTPFMAMSPPRREILMDSAPVTGFKPNLRGNEHLMTLLPPAHAELASPPMTPHVEPMRPAVAPHKIWPAPPAPYESPPMGRTQRRFLTSRSSRPNPSDIIYTHNSQPLFLPPEFVATATTAIPAAKKRRGHPTEDRVYLMMSDEEGIMQPVKKKRSGKVMNDSMGVSQGIRSTPTKISPLVWRSWDQTPVSSSENITSQDPFLGQIPLPKFSPFVSAGDQVPKAPYEKVVSTLAPYVSEFEHLHKAPYKRVASTDTLAPYVSTWDQVPKSVSENEIRQETFTRQVTLPVESKSHDFLAQDVDGDTAAEAGGSAPHALAGGNVPTNAETATKEEGDPSESELETAGSNGEETALQITI